MDRSKILDKIKKCLALSKSPNEHEAAAALRQAQKLMERNGITEKEIGAIGFGGCHVDIPVQAGKSVPLYLAHFFSLIRDAFGVRNVITRTVRVSDASFTVHYFGPEHRVMLAEYAHEVVWRAMNNSWAAYLKEHPEVKGARGARTGYLVGWIMSVQDKVQDFGMTEEETCGTDIVVAQRFPKLTKTKTANMAVNGGTLGAGMSAGAAFNLHRPMAGRETLKIGG